MATLIAEVGQNHCGDMELARTLIREAKDNGADLVKFQLYDHNILYKDHPEIPDIALSKNQAFDLFNYGREVGIEVFFSVFDTIRVKWCEEMGVKRYKIACSQWGNFLLWREVEQTRKSIICSAKFIPCYPVYGTMLYCVPKYPTNIKDLNFKEMTNFDGFSDHTIGLDAAKIALARGTRIIEKHFAIDHHTGVDAEWSMTPKELRELRRFADVTAEAL